MRSCAPNQLLVSPSAVAYLIREQLYDDGASGYRTIERLYPPVVAYRSA